MALTRSQRPMLRRDTSDPHRVTWLELFFDLVYVAALIQLGDRLADDVSWGGVARFVGVFVVLWWTWTGTTVVVNRFAADDLVHRVLTFVQMWAVGTLAVVAASTSVENASTWFVVAYVGARVPMLLMYLRVRTGVAAGDPIVPVYVATFGFGSLLWSCSLFFSNDVRPYVWGIALAIEFVTPILVNRGRPSEAPIHDEHFQERYALFTIIVLGETFVKTLSEISEIGISVQTNVFGGFAFALLIAQWWTYFDDVAGTEISRTSMLGRTRTTNRLWWVYAHLPLAAGLTAFGVASKKLVAVPDFGDDLKNTYAWLLVGALAVVLVSVAVLDAVTVSPHVGVRTGSRVALRIAAAVTIVLVGVLLANGTLTALVGVGLIAVIAVAQIAGEVTLAAATDRRIDANVAGSRDRDDGPCEHLAEDEVHHEWPTPSSAGLECRHCHEDGVPWVQLRLCLVCGHVGCCDDSPGQHATEHHRLTGHPTIATLVAGDSWAYCYDHDVTDGGWWRERSPAS